MTDGVRGWIEGGEYWMSGEYGGGLRAARWREVLGEGWGTGVGFRAGRGREVLGEWWVRGWIEGRHREGSDG